MQTKTNVLVFSLAAILALSVVAMSDIPQATADKDDKQKKLKFKKQADFTADCVQTGNAPTDPSVDWDCTALFWLDKKGENLKYKIEIQNMDLNGWQTVIYDHNGDLDPIGAADDVTAVHLHDAALTPGPLGPHVLNVWQDPIQDDAQMKAYPALGMIEGVYDDGDVTPHHVGLHHGPSLTLTDKVDDLCNGDFYVMVHKGPGVLKGDAIPTKQGEKLCKKLGY